MRAHYFLSVILELQMFQTCEYIIDAIIECTERRQMPSHGMRTYMKQSVPAQIMRCRSTLIAVVFHSDTTILFVRVVNSVNVKLLKCKYWQTSVR